MAIYEVIIRGISQRRYGKRASVGGNSCEGGGATKLTGFVGGRGGSV